MLVETGRCGRLFVEVHDGDPGLPTVLLWHSVMCDGAMWSSVPRSLAAAGYRVINIDAPGHGRSSPVSTQYTLDDNVDAATAVMRACDVRRAVWCGLSWGGMVGMRLALRPRRAAIQLEGLVLIASNADAETPSKLPSYRVMQLIERVLGPIPMLLDRLEPIFFSPRTVRERRDIVEAFRERVRAMDHQSLMRVLDGVIFGRQDIRPKLPDIDLPTLVMVGADDRATPIPRSEDIANRIPGARLVIVPDAGHLVSWEQPEWVAKEILSFLASLPR